MHSFKRFLIFFSFLLLLSCLASCSPEYINGLEFESENNTLIKIYRSDKNQNSQLKKSYIASGKETIFSLEKAVSISGKKDLAIALIQPLAIKENLRLTVSILERKKGQAKDYYFELPYEHQYELRIAINEGMNISSISFTNDGQDLELIELGLKEKFEGIEHSDFLLRIDNLTFNNLNSGNGSSIALHNIGRANDSVYIKSINSGKVKIIDKNTLKGFNAQLEANSSLYIPASLLPSTILIDADCGIAEAYLVSAKNAALADPHSLLWLEASGLGWRYYRWATLPNTLIIVFDDYDFQDLYLKRLAFFAEKPGFRGRVAKDAEIKGLHGWNAHDYAPETLANFYNLAADGVLNKYELELKNLLIDMGIITQKDKTLVAGTGAVISIALESGAALRRLFMDHEASHALYFQDAEYRKLVARLWYELSPAAKRFWKIHLAWRSYDIKDEGLCINEYQSYLMQQGSSNTAVYLEGVTERLMEAYPDKKENILDDSVLAIAEAVEAVKKLDVYLKTNYGLQAGGFGKAKRER